jgi:ABC-type Fe3+/spermidine/putrescine transport system ATPase subunit
MGATALTAALSLRHVTKRFPGGIVALDSVTLDVDDGEMFVVLGQSAAGKTSLLRVVAGLDRPTSGAVYLDGHAADRWPAGERPVSMMFQSQALFPHLSAASNVAYGLRRTKDSKDDARELVEGLLDLVGLPGLGARRPAALSEDQRRRLAFARSLARRPRILLLDNPASGLDDPARDGLRAVLHRVQRSTGITFVLATDDADEFAVLADRGAVLESGAVRQVGTPAALRDQPATRRIAELVGRMNVWEGRVVGSEAGRAVVDLAGLGRVRVAGALPTGRDIAVALAPERISVSIAAPANVEAMPAFVRAIAFAGRRRRVVLRAADGAPMTAVDVPSGVREGDAVWVAWPEDAVVVLSG